MQLDVHAWTKLTVTIYLPPMLKGLCISRGSCMAIRCAMLWHDLLYQDCGMAQDYKAT